MGRERHAVTRAGDDTPQGNPRPASLQEQKAPLLRCGRKKSEDTRANDIEQQVGLGLLAEDTELREGKPAQDQGSADNLQSFAHSISFARSRQSSCASSPLAVYGAHLVRATLRRSLHVALHPPPGIS